MSERRIAGVVLAAGLSTRLGRPKQLEVLNNETLVERTVRIATAAGLSPVIAVVLASELIPSLQSLGAMVLINRRTYEGLASSIRVGLQAAAHQELDGLVLMTCDQVALTEKHLRALCEQQDQVTGSLYAGRVGVPAYFPRASFDALLQLEGDKGARDMLRGVRSVACEDLALDVDTEQDLERAKKFLALQQG